MAEHSTIEWTDATWNPITGCSVVSPGCTNCYAMRLAGTRLQHHPSRAGLTRDSKAGPVWTGEVRFNEQWLDQPLRWKRPRRIFVCAHGDLFHENVPDEWIDRVFAVMAMAHWHTFQVLTKRAQRMQSYIGRTLYNEPCNINEHIADMGGDPDAWSPPLPNVWPGVSAEDQQRADERIPYLLATPAAVRWVSAEPLLGASDYTRITPPDGDTRTINALTGEAWYPGCGSISSQTLKGPRIDWVVAGGESGAGARPMHPDWARSLRDQCKAAGVPFHFKQWGEWSPIDRWYAADLRPQIALRRSGSLMPDEEWHDDGYRLMRIGKARSGRLLDGIEHNGMPGRG